MSHISNPLPYPLSRLRSFLASYPTGMFRIVVDFESFYDSDYSLNRLSPPEYILGPRWECLGASIRFDTHPLNGSTGACTGVYAETAFFVDPDDLFVFFEEVPWRRAAMVSHNIGFDGAILAWRYGFAPALYIDTLGLARAFTHYKAGRSSLAATAKHLGLPDKGGYVENMRGWTLAMLREDEARGGDKFRRYREYCVRDSDLASWVCDRLAPQLPRDEWLLMDMVARMAILPQLGFDPVALTAYNAKVVNEKQELLARLQTMGVLDGDTPRKDMMSNERFAQLLRDQGVDPPMKKSPATGEMTYAFAKTDDSFTELESHDDPVVQALVACRLGVKSTQEETRSARFINVTRLAWPPTAARALVSAGAPALTSDAIDVRPGDSFTMQHITSGVFPAPFPLRFSGAHTHRLSGDWSWNLQNLQRANKDLGRKAELRRSLVAPPGYDIVSADASQIEARIVAELAGATRITRGFANGEDVYSTFASMVYDYAVNKHDHKTERFVGKTGVLGLGFGMGPPKFVLTCWNQGRKRIDLPLSSRVVKTYRLDYAPEVPVYWKRMERLALAMCRGENAVDGCLTVIGQRILLPNGMFLFYDGITQTTAEKQITTAQGKEITVNGSEITYKHAGRTKYTFGGKLTENVVQALARIITMSAAIRLKREWGVRHQLAGQVHDQLIYVVPKSESLAMAHALVHAMRIPPSWLPNLPLDAEASIGPNLRDMEDVKVPRIAAHPRFAS